MSVSYLNVEAGPYYPNGVATTFGFGFGAAVLDQVRVVRRVGDDDTVVLSSLYSVSFESDGEGGSVHFTVPPATAGGALYVQLIPSFEQETSFTNSGFLPATLNPVLDRSARRDIYLRGLVERVEAVVNRAILVPFGETPPSYDELAETFRGYPGLNGGTSSNLTIGVFTGAAGSDLTAGGTKPAPMEVVTAGYAMPTPPAAATGGARYVLDPIVNAAFVTAHPGWSFRDSQGNGYRLNTEQRVLFEMFGSTGGATLSHVSTANDTPWQRAKDFIHFYRVFPGGNAYYKPSIPVYFSPTGYEFSSYLDLTDAAYELFGSGPAGAGGGGGTTFFFTGTCGLVLQSWDTAGVNLTSQPNNTTTPHGASNSHIRDITLYSRGGTVGAEQHGALIKCVGTTWERVTALNFGGDGFHIFGNTPGSGNANCNNFYFCGGHNNGLNGVYVAAGDGNANTFIQFQANNNRKFGIAECSFLGNSWLSYHTAGNGMPQAHGCGPNWAGLAATTVPGARVRQGGHTYLVRPGQDTAAITTTPGTNGAVWVDQGTTDPGWAEAWVSGHLYASGGGVYIGGSTFSQNNNNRSVMTGYNEGDQPGGWGDSNCSLNIAGNGGVGPGIFGGLGAVLANSVGSRQIRTDGTPINAMFGGDPNNGNQWLQLGFSDTPAWSGKMDSGYNIYFDFNNGGASVPLLLVAGTSLPGCVLPRGVSIGALVNAANDAAAATGGVAVGAVYRNGSILMTRVT